MVRFKDTHLSSHTYRVLYMSGMVLGVGDI